MAWVSDNGAPIQLLGTLGGCCSSGVGINDAGDAVGSSYTPDTHEPGHAFLYHDGAMVDLGTGYPTRGSSMARSVNSARQAVGERAAPATFTGLATLWRDGELIDLGTLGGNDSTAYGIKRQRPGCRRVPHEPLWISRVPVAGRRDAGPRNPTQEAARGPSTARASSPAGPPTPLAVASTAASGRMALS